MIRVFSICVVLSFGILQCLSQDQPQEPSVAEYFQEAVDLANRTRWRYFLPEDTDIDQDGRLSDLEIQHKFNTYMGEIFRLMDHDKDNSITEEELRSLKLDIPHLTKAVDIALENFPLRPFFIAADANGDGVYDEDDFLMPEKISREVASLEGNHRGTTVVIDDYNNQVTLDYHDVGIAKIGQNEGDVICKSLGFGGLEKVMAFYEMKEQRRHSSVVAYTCDGTEERLEDCQKDYKSYTAYDSMGMVCKGEGKIGDLRLVGGKDSSAGDIMLGKKGMTCNPWEFQKTNLEVICRELGYSGVVRMTMSSAFADIYMDENMRTEKFKCTGKEQKLADCPVVTGEKCWDSSLYGVICAKDGQAGMDQGLSNLLDWPHTSITWEKGGRFLLIADANGDGKLTLEELATKGKELVTKILEFLDENQDGKISLEDIILHLEIGPIQNLVLELFDDVTAGGGEFDLYFMKVAGQDMTKYWFPYEYDENRDAKLNAADLFSFLDSRTKATFLLPMLSKKLDKNQDGKIQRDELRQFVDDLFNHLDMDKDGALTLEDVYSLFQENGMDCLQVGALRTYIEIFLDTLDAEIRSFFVYIFHQFDIDGNGQISPSELEQMHVPCDTNDRYGYKDYDYNPYQVPDPKDRKSCRDLNIFGGKISDLIRSAPFEQIFNPESHGRGRGGGHGRGGRDGPPRETFVQKFTSKLTNRACQILT